MKKYEIGIYCPAEKRTVRAWLIPSGDWFEVAETECCQTLGKAFGMMCRCWEQARNNAETVLFRRDPELWPQALRYLHELKERRGRHDAALAASAAAIIIAAVGEGLAPAEALEAIRHLELERSQADGVLNAAAAYRINLAPMAAASKDPLVRAVLQRNMKAVEAEFTTMNDWLLGRPNTASILRYLQSHGEDISRVLAICEKRLSRASYGELLKELGLPTPELTGEERAMKRNHNIYERIAQLSVYIYNDFEDHERIGQLRIETCQLPDQTRGATFWIGDRQIEPREVVRYLREYAIQLLKAAEDVESTLTDGE